MSETLGRILVPDIPASGEFPLHVDYPFVYTHEPEIVIHRFGDLAAQVEQRYILGDGTRTYTIKKNYLTPKDQKKLKDWWLINQGIFGAFTFHRPNPGGSTTDVTVRFKQQNLTLEAIHSCIVRAGLELIEVPDDSAAPSYTQNGPALNRFPDAGLAAALTEEVQVIVPLLEIQPILDSAYPKLYVSDRRCTINGQLYQARMVDFEGIEQGMGGESDLATFSFGNADDVMTAIANDTNLFRSRVQFSLFHVNTKTRLDLWAGDLVDWQLADGSPIFTIQASDGLYELGLSYPPRKCSRTCTKVYLNAENGCDFATRGHLYASRTLRSPVKDSKGNWVAGTVTLNFTPDAAVCDKGYDSPNGCLAHGMEDRFFGIVAHIETIKVQDNSTGWHGIGRNSQTSVSSINDSIYNKGLPQIYVDLSGDPDPALGLPVDCMIAASIDEGEFYNSLAIVGEGPLGDYSAITETEDNYYNDGQNNHGYTSGGFAKGQQYWGLRRANGYDPIIDNGPDANSEWFSLGQGGAGPQFYSYEKAAGVAFVENRRQDQKGLQFIPVAHSVQVPVRLGLGGDIWNDDGLVFKDALTNPIWIMINAILRAKGVWSADETTKLQYFDLEAAKAAAAICDLSVPKLFDTGNETQFTFMGVIGESKSLRDWLLEIANTSLAYFTFANGKFKVGIRENSSAVSAFTEGNILFKSLRLGPIKPTFNDITGNFADRQYGFVKNSVRLYDETYCTIVGNQGRPEFIPKEMNFVGVTDKSTAARIITTRLREELSGYRPETFKYGREGSFKTTILALDTEAGMVCSLTHPACPTYPATASDDPDLQGEVPNYIEFRNQRWKLYKDYSVEIQFKTTHNDNYALDFGPKPPDVTPPNVPVEDKFPPANWRFSARTKKDGNLILENFAVGRYGSAVHLGIFDIYYIDEAQDRFSSLVFGCDANPDHNMLVYHGVPPTEGEWVLIGDELMEVVKVEPLDSVFLPEQGTFTVKRGALGTEPAFHTRSVGTISAVHDWPCKLDVSVSIGDLHEGEYITPVGSDLLDGQPITFYDADAGVLNTALPLGSFGTWYSDPRIWRVKVKQHVLSFPPRLFLSPNRAAFFDVVDLPMAGVVLINGILENTRGLKSKPVVLQMTGNDHLGPVEQPFHPKWPYRVRTLGNHRFVWTLDRLPLGEIDDAVDKSPAAEGQAFEFGLVTATNGAASPIDTPASMSSIVATELRPSGKVIFDGESDDHAEVQVIVSGGNEYSSPTWRAVDQGITGSDTTAAIAQSVADFLNLDERFASMFSASADANALLIEDDTGMGGEVSAIIASHGDNPLTAAASGFTGFLGVTKGRKYAAAFVDSGAGYRSELGAASITSGPSGDAQTITIKDVPVSSDPRVDKVEIYASPDGQDWPPRLAGIVDNETTTFGDATTEADLAALPAWPGSSQPPAPGDITVTMLKDGNPWFQMNIPGSKNASDEVNGFSVDPIATDNTLSMDIINNAGDDLSLFVELQ